MISSPVHIARMGFSMQFDFLLSEMLDARRSLGLEASRRTSDLGCSAKKCKCMWQGCYFRYNSIFCLAKFWMRYEVLKYKCSAELQIWDAVRGVEKRCLPRRTQSTVSGARFEDSDAMRPNMKLCPKAAACFEYIPIRCNHNRNQYHEHYERRPHIHVRCAQESVTKTVDDIDNRIKIRNRLPCTA